MEEQHWLWSREHRQVCKLLDQHTLWGNQVVRIWLPGADAVVKTSADQLVPLEQMPPMSSHELKYLVTAARISDHLSHNILRPH
ncbi:hypothetical protein WDW89_08455 [Deltaproteobacteria bacterium TL4]